MATARMPAFLAGVLGLLALAGCTPQVDPIEYGFDQCQYCRMTISDSRFSAQLVSQTGKNYKFDAIECMVWFMNENTLDESEMAYILVADFLNQKMISAQDAYFLISDSIRSPMGASLAAFSSREKAEEFRERWGGTLFTWKELRTHLRKAER